MTENAPDVAIRWVLGLQARGVTPRIRNGRLFLQPASAYRELSDEELITLRHHRAEIKALVECGRFAAPVVPAPAIPEPTTRPVAAAPEPDPEPEVYVYGRRVTEGDVIDALTSLCDQALASYHSGQLSKREAYDIARRRLRQAIEMR